MPLKIHSMFYPCGLKGIILDLIISIIDIHYRRLFSIMADNRPWILATTLPFVHEQRVIADKAFRLVVWRDFLLNQDKYRDKIQGILYIPSEKPSDE